MAKVSRHSRFNAPPQKAPGAIILMILKGLVVSLVVSLICTFFLSLISLVSDSSFVEHYLSYLMVGITVTSIFIGSAYATQKAQSMGLIIGMAIGLLYVLISVGIGVKLSPEPLSWLVLTNKFFAGLAAGALGGLVGVNL